MLYILGVIIIIELISYSSTLNIRELYIEKINHIIVSDYSMLYEFLNLFFSQDNKLYIGNNRIDNKSSYIINLLDYESISNQLTLKKGTILYDYLIDELNEKTELTNIKEEIEIKLKTLIEKATEEKTIDYNFDFNVDLSKIISNYVKFDIDLSIKNYTKIIKQLIYNLKVKNPKKIIVILLNERIFHDELDDLGDIYMFKFNSINFPNILIGEKIINIDRSLLLNQLILNWPEQVSEEKLNKIMEMFITYYKNSDTLITCDVYSYIGYKLISKILSIKCTCIYQNEFNNNLPEIYKNYINSLKN